MVWNPHLSPESGTRSLHTLKTTCSTQDPAFPPKLALGKGSRDYKLQFLWFHQSSRGKELSPPTPPPLPPGPIIPRFPPPSARFPVPRAASRTHRTEAKGLWSLARRGRSFSGDNSASRLLLGGELNARCSLGRSSRAGSRRQSTRGPTPRGSPQHPALLASSTFPPPPSLFFCPLPPLGLMLGEGRGEGKSPVRLTPLIPWRLSVRGIWK